MATTSGRGKEGGGVHNLEGGDAFQARLLALVLDNDEGTTILVKDERHACTRRLARAPAPTTTTARRAMN